MWFGWFPLCCNHLLWWEAFYSSWVVTHIQSRPAGLFWSFFELYGKAGVVLDTGYEYVYSNTHFFEAFLILFFSVLFFYSLPFMQVLSCPDTLEFSHGFQNIPTLQTFYCDSPVSKKLCISMQQKWWIMFRGNLGFLNGGSTTYINSFGRWGGFYIPEIGK